MTLMLYRVTVSEHLRNARLGGNPDAMPPLALDLHYLVTAWAANVLVEQVLVAWTAQLLHRTAILSASTLTPEAGWTEDEVIHIVPAELTTEDLMRIWDALSKPYRVSLTYTARVLRLDAGLSPPPPRVVATRLSLGGD